MLEETDKYTPHQVIRILFLGSSNSSVEEWLDVAHGLSRLPEPMRSVLQLAATGVGMGASMEAYGVRGNSTRYFREAQRMLTDLVNGESLETKDSTDQQRPVLWQDDTSNGIGTARLLDSESLTDTSQ